MSKFGFVCRAVRTKIYEDNKDFIYEENKKTKQLDAISFLYSEAVDCHTLIPEIPSLRHLPPLSVRTVNQIRQILPFFSHPCSICLSLQSVQIKPQI